MPAALGLVFLLLLIGGARAARIWEWRYSGVGIIAAGTFTTDDTPDLTGFYRITAISGQRNGAPIIALQPAGTPIQGNEPYAVDNRVRPEEPQLTKAGFGFATRDGAHTNPFFADFGSPPAYREFQSSPDGDRTERPVTFSARPR